MALLTLQSVAPAGITPAYVAAAAGGDAFPCGTDERNFVEIVNGGGASITVTAAPARTSAKVPGVGNLTIPSFVSTIAAGARAILGPFPPAYADGSGNVNLTYSAVTTVTVGAFRLPFQSY